MFKTISPSEDLNEEQDFDLAWLKTVIEEAATRHGCRWILIDPWNEVEHLWGRQDTEAIYLNRALRELKRLGRRFQICIIIVAHPTKEGGKAKSVREADFTTSTAAPPGTTRRTWAWSFGPTTSLSRIVL